MKYCENCHRIITNGENCTCGNGKLSELEPQSGVKVADVKGSLRAIVEPAMMEKGIPFQFFNPEKDIYTQYNAKVNSETNFSLLVPFEFYNEAFEVCVGLGLAVPEDRIAVDESTQSNPADKTYEERFEKATGTKRKTFQIIMIVLFIVVACLLIWGIDLIAALIKGNYYDVPFTNYW